MAEVQRQSVIGMMAALPQLQKPETVLLYKASRAMFDHRPPPPAHELEVTFATKSTCAALAMIYRARIRRAGGGSAEADGGSAEADAGPFLLAEWKHYVGGTVDPWRDDQHFYCKPSGSTGIRTTSAEISLRFPGCSIEYEYVVLLDYFDMPQHIREAFEQCRGTASLPTLAGIRLAVGFVEKYFLLANIFP